MENKNQIKLLPVSVVEKIAAGEVVERPAAVLKELIENSIDAGAARIDITVEDAGFSMMKISDNGCGMSGNDLGMSVLRHATSKIRKSEDLFSIATMGFRGEALASIAAVSRMSVAASDNDSGLGSEIIVEGGAAGRIKPVSHLHGTTITVRDLFFNVPARKKFMKTARGETLAVIRMLEQIVVPFPAIHFTASIDGKRVLEAPCSVSLRDRICRVAGNDFSRGLIECVSEGEGFSIRAFVSTPEKMCAKPRFQSLYVNLRRIDNDSVTAAIRKAFAQYLGANNRPGFFCFLDIDPKHIDVNVHPTKQQIKFDEESSVFSFVYHTVKDGLKAAGVTLNDLSIENQRQGSVGDTSGENLSSNTYHYSIDEIRQKAACGCMEKGTVYNIHPPEFSNRSALLNDSDCGSVQTILDFPQPFQEVKGNSGSGHIAETQTALISGSGEEQVERHCASWELITCFQIHSMFILAPIKNGILLIDQHAAHERVLYEQAMRDFETAAPISQQLLFPIVFEMSLTEKAVLVSANEYFIKLGFEVADFGDTAVSVSALPAFLKDRQTEETLREMVRYLLDGRSAGNFTEPQKRFAAAFACGAAIKSGQKLSQDEMNALLNSLFSTNNPYTCPHGRPTLVRISVDELARRFLR
ncbi:MAG: DNA mismatch repair endonuclease MutL [Chitinispirillales bacterium]|jgi:DNA mismatch repair protein MutL|nr:DNA mismatch repair endonuclease MutL [Chitinispirillales bacterium]